AQGVAQRVETDPLDALVDRGGVAATGRQLAAGQGQVVVGHYLVGWAEAVAGAEQDGRPPDGVEPDVVLADEGAVAGRRTLPPRPPGVRVALAVGPFHRRRQVADDGVEPHVEPAVVPTGQGHGAAP